MSEHVKKINLPAHLMGRSTSTSEIPEQVSVAGERALAGLRSARGYRGAQGEGIAMRAGTVEPGMYMWPRDPEWVSALKRYLIAAGANHVEYVHHDEGPFVEVWVLRNPVEIETVDGDRFTPEINPSEETAAAIQRIVRDGVWRHTLDESRFVPPHRIASVAVQYLVEGSTGTDA